MKSTQQLFAVLSALIFVSAAGYAAQPSVKPGSQASTRAQVTFVELGSVNCVPCKMMQPVMADIEKEYAGRVNVVFYDVWTKEGEPQGKKYRIQAIPTQVFLDKDGKEFFRHIGFYPKDEIVKILEKQGIQRSTASPKPSKKNASAENYTVTGSVCK